MGVRDFIERTKASFSAAARADKLQLQKTMLAERRKKAEAANLERAKMLRLKTDVAEEKRKLRLAKGARFAETKDKARKGLVQLKKLGDAVKANRAKREKNMSKLGTVGGSPNFMSSGKQPKGGVFADKKGKGGVFR